jgi:hypothetical protein
MHYNFNDHADMPNSTNDIDKVDCIFCLKQLLAEGKIFKNGIRRKILDK